jgi:hypothetical protein
MNEFSVPQRASVVDVMPPRWEVGDSWRVEMGVNVGPDQGGMISQVSYPFRPFDEDLDDIPHVVDQSVDFTVTEAPADAAGHYTVEGIVDSHQKAVFQFRARPFMLDSVSVDDRHFLGRAPDEVGPNLRPGEHDMNIAFPFLPPDDPADPKRGLTHRVYTFGHDHDLKERVQHWRNGVWFTLWSTMKTGPNPVVFFWRYGDPWWSSMAEMCPATDGSPSVCRWGWLVRNRVHRHSAEPGQRP